MAGGEKGLAMRKASENDGGKFGGNEFRYYFFREHAPVSIKKK